MTIRRVELALVATLALVYGAAPTVGDVGSCGKTATDLDPVVFAAARKDVDCSRCRDCGISSVTCRGACDRSALPTAGWPTTCHPLEHDGDVCLRALHAAACSDYAAYVDDTAPTVPTECDFCHLVGDGAVVSGKR